MSVVPNRLSAFAVVATIVIASAAHAQLPPTRGAVVRLHRLTAHGDTESVVARWHLASRDSVVVAPGRVDSGWVLSIARSELAGVDIERNANAENATIATFGIIGGLTAGVAALKWCADDPALCEDQRSSTDCDTTSHWPFPVVLAVGGALVGGLIGEALGPHRYWEPIILPTEVGVTPDGRRRWQMLVGVRIPIRNAPRTTRATRRSRD